MLLVLQHRGRDSASKQLVHAYSKAPNVWQLVQGAMRPGAVRGAAPWQRRILRKNSDTLQGPHGWRLSQGTVSPELFEGLLMLQHRGQDSAGMVTTSGRKFFEHKDNGLVNDVFSAKTMSKLEGALQRVPPAALCRACDYCQGPQTL